MRWLLALLMPLAVSGQQVVQLCPDSDLTFTYYCTSDYSGLWVWTVNGDSISDDYFVTITWDSVGTYEIVAQYDNGCAVIPREYIVNVLACLQQAIYFPNSFSPNGDGINDYWKPEFIGVDDIRWYIFDRWGLQLYAAHGKEDRWDGCMWHDGQRRPCQADVYVWLAEWYYFKGGWQSKTGRVTIAR